MILALAAAEKNTKNAAAERLLFSHKHRWLKISYCRFAKKLTQQLVYNCVFARQKIYRHTIRFALRSNLPRVLVQMRTRLLRTLNQLPSTSLMARKDVWEPHKDARFDTFDVVEPLV